MNFQVPVRRLAGAVRSPTSYSSPSLHLRHMLPTTQRRTLWDFWKRKKTEPTTSSTKPSDGLTPLDKAIANKQSSESKAANRIFNPEQGESIFEDDKVPETAAGREMSEQDKLASQQMGMELSKLKEHMQRAVDPDPRWRIRYTRRKVMQMVRNAREPTREERILMSEKKVVSQSTPLPTSTKKLGHLARQIVGKTVDEAIVQMKFSKKKMAREVRYELERARDLAIVSRGMGLGRHTGELLKEPKQIKTKDGKRIEVTDPTSLYVDESWVNKGPYRGMRIQYHARSRMSPMWKPSTRLAVVLKEEKTRVRQHEERVEKQAKAKPWVHLPNRPVTAQRPYYSW